MKAIHVPNCEEDLVNKVQKCAKDRERSVASLVRAILKEWVGNNPPNPTEK